jgi:diguanylate cyclase (GGDEF)-like protein
VDGKDRHVRPGAAGSALRSGRAERRRRPTTVLVIDEDPAIQELATAALGQRGYRTLAVGGGEAALAAVAREEPDVIVLDASVDELGGPDLIRRLRREPSTAYLPIVLLTGEDRGEEVASGFEAGADDYLRKPFIGVELQARVRAALARAHHLTHLIDTARTDALTGLPNRRAWDEELPRDLVRARGAGQPLCLALFDLDHFKRFNDEYGHQAGDRLLRQVAAEWLARVRETDLLARYGGEEFGLVLRGAGREEAEAAVERLRAAMPEPHTCSAGLAAWDGRESVEALVDRADQALYAAKAAGRDALMVASSTGERPSRPFRPRPARREA